MPRPHMQIGEVAARTGLTQRTLRFYEERGLLRPATRLEGGFRLYTEDDLNRIERIVQFRNVLGLSIPETKRMIEAEDTLEELKQQFQQESDAEARRTQLVQAIDLIQHEEGLVAERIQKLQAMGEQWRIKLERYRRRLAELDRDAHARQTVSPAPRT